MSSPIKNAGARFDKKTICSHVFSKKNQIYEEEEKDLLILTKYLFDISLIEAIIDQSHISTDCVILIHILMKYIYVRRNHKIIQ